MGNKGAKVAGPPDDTSTTKLTSTSPTSEGKHTDEFKFFDKALKVFDSERKTKVRRKFRELVRESKTATIKWQKLEELYDDDTEKWKYNYFNALRSTVKTVMSAYDNENPIASYEYITNLINLATLVIDFRKTRLKIQERKGIKIPEAQRMAFAEWVHAQKKLKGLLTPADPKNPTIADKGEPTQCSSSNNGNFKSRISSA